MSSKFPYINELGRFINNEFFYNRDERLTLDDLPGGVRTHFANQTGEDQFNPSLLMTHLNAAVESGMKPSDTDFKLSGSIHSLLLEHGINRSIAAMMPVWHFMTVFWFKEYVAWRFSAAVEGRRAEAKRRFLGSIDRNAISRLWLWADLTYDRDAEDPYHITKYSFNQNVPNFALMTVLPNNRRLMRLIANFIIQNAKIANTERGVKFLFPRIRILNSTRKLYMLDDKQIINYLDGFLARIV